MHKNHIRKPFWEMQDAYTSSSNSLIILQMETQLFVLWCYCLLLTSSRGSLYRMHTLCTILPLEVAGNSPIVHSYSVSGLRIYSRGPLEFIFSPLEVADTCYLFSSKLVFADFYISASFTEYRFLMQEAENLLFWNLENSSVTVQIFTCYSLFSFLQK